MPRTRASAWWREPLLHFVVLAVLLFALERVMSPSLDASRIVTIGADVMAELIEEFARRHGRSPSAAELDPLVETWLRDELLYREGLAFGLDQGDPMIRERVIHKMRLVVFNNVEVREPTDEQLREWFEANRKRYEKPERFSFVLARLRGSERNDRSAAANVVPILNEASHNGAPALSPGGNTHGSLRGVEVTGFHDRPRSNVIDLFGEGFAEALRRQPEKEWHIVEASGRWYAVRVEKILPPVTLEFQSVRNLLANDWRAAEGRRLARGTVEELREDYLIRRGQKT